MKKGSRNDQVWKPWNMESTIFCQIHQSRGVKIFSFFTWVGVKQFSIALRGGFNFFIISFQIRAPSYCWVMNDQPLIFIVEIDEQRY